MKCTYCGYENGMMGGFCRNCGKKLPETAQNGQTSSNQTGNTTNPNMQMGSGYGQPNFNQMKNTANPSAQNQIWGTIREREFYQRFASKSTKILVILMAVLSFLNAAVSGFEMISNAREVRLAMMFSDELRFFIVIVIIETIYFIVMGILLLVLQKWFLPLIAIIEAILSMAFVTIITENFSGRGILFIVIAFLCMLQLKKVSDAYRRYKNTGNTPENLV